MFFDPSGFKTEIIIESGSRKSNFYGHAVIAIDDVVYSFAPYHSSTNKIYNLIGDGVLLVVDKETYLSKRNEERSYKVFKLNITDEEEDKILRFYADLINEGKLWTENAEYVVGKYYKFDEDNKYYKYIAIEVNCTTIINDVLKSGLSDRKIPRSYDNNIWMPYMLDNWLTYIENAYNYDYSKWLYNTMFPNGDIVDCIKYVPKNSKK